MAPNKLQKFSEMESIPFVFQYPFSVLKEKGFPMSGLWRENFFCNTHPIVLELGCGKGEYTVGLARKFSKKNFIGVDIKGARMWSGATEARDSEMKNVAFLRTHIEMIDSFFGGGEVDEIWITFPDPQMKKTRKRLTSTRFIDLYRKILKPGGIVHLKTDSQFLFTYTLEMLKANPEVFKILSCTDDLYASKDTVDDILEIKTHYERQWIERGLTIKYLAFTVGHGVPLREIDDEEIERDTYKSYGRGYTEGEKSQEG